jgi:Fe2+ or Zn2+ uptake regulation protein
MTDLAECLREQGLKVTAPRREVWAVLNNATGHLTADQIGRQVSGINQATIYRTLALFAELGLAKESQMGIDGASRWEVAHSDDQFHLICSACGSVQHHGGDLVDRVRRHVDSDHGFDVQSISLSVSGLCHECRVG